MGSNAYGQCGHPLSQPFLSSPSLIPPPSRPVSRASMCVWRVRFSLSSPSASFTIPLTRCLRRSEIRDTQNDFTTSMELYRHQEERHTALLQFERQQFDLEVQVTRQSFYNRLLRWELRRAAKEGSALVSEHLAERMESFLREEQQVHTIASLLDEKSEACVE